MNVYVVVEQDYDSHEVKGVFTSTTGVIKWLKSALERDWTDESWQDLECEIQELHIDATSLSRPCEMLLDNHTVTLVKLD